MTKLLFLSLAAIWAALFLAACGTDEAKCGGLINTGSITSSSFTANCASAGSNAGTTDRHDTTDNHATTAPEGG